jgi:aspartate/methionine/tyrosine aminotransferase
METANRLNGIGEYYFSQKLREIEALNANGEPVINLGIGSPDLAPHANVIRVLQEQGSQAQNHAYQNYKGVAPLRKAISSWYRRWYGVNLDPDTEILPLIGSKEGIMHVCMTYLDEGDLALVPDPGYPTYRSAVKLAGGQCLDYRLTVENQYYPDFNALEQLVVDANGKGAGKVKLMWVNYPHMPTGQLPQKGLFDQLVAFGKKHNILICHDNPYSFILNDNPMSLLAAEGAKDIAIELNSLSKSHNMAGWRVGMLCGAGERINEILRFKSNMDSGMFLPVQLAAAEALALDQEWFSQLNAVYAARREKVFQLLDTIGCLYSREQAGLFIWASIPEGYADGYAISDLLLREARVFITPGGIFGKAGDPFIRVSLCSPEEKLQASIERIKRSVKEKV